MKSQSGFKGKGFKFDETEAHLVSERKKLQRAAMGFQDSDDEESGMDVSDIYLHILMAVFDNKSCRIADKHVRTTSIRQALISGLLLME